MKPIPRAAAVALLIILSGSVVLQWRGLFNDVCESIHGWRQCQTAMIARNFVRDGMNPFVARPDYMGEGQMQLELPLYSYLVAVGYKVFGINEALGRIVALFFGVGSTVVLFQIGRLVRSARAGLVAALVFAWSPLNVFFNRAVMPDSSTIFFMLAAVWAFLSFFRDARTSRALLGAAAIGLSLCGKPPVVLTVLPALAASYFLVYGRAFWRQARPNLALLFSIMVFVLWMRYAHGVNYTRAEDIGLGQTNAGQYASLVHHYFGTWEEHLQMKAYGRIVNRVPDWVGHWGVGVLALMAACARPRLNMHWVVPVWMLGAAAYLAVFLHLNFVHNYYQMPVIPPLALACGVAVDRILGGSTDAAASATRGLAQWSSLGVILFAGIQFHQSRHVLQRYNPDQEGWPDYGTLAVQPDGPPEPSYYYWQVRQPVVDLAREVNAHLPPGRELIALVAGRYSEDIRDPVLLYHIDRRGFIIQASDALVWEPNEPRVGGRERRVRFNRWVSDHLLDTLEVVRRKDVRLLIVMEPNDVLSDPVREELSRRLETHYRDPHDRFVVYRLGPPPPL